MQVASDFVTIVRTMYILYTRVLVYIQHEYSKIVN